ncbi:MAG: hypothetical protein VYE40_01200 [Myxococcota bacterium]|nr:hypothetical protein [Myxococcota bacterium]
MQTSPSCEGRELVCDGDRVVAKDSCGSIIEAVETCGSQQICSARDPASPDRTIDARCVERCGVGDVEMVGCNNTNNTSPNNTSANNTASNNTSIGNNTTPANNGMIPMLVCSEENPKKVYRADENGEPASIKTSCSGVQTCGVGEDGEARCECPLTGSNRCYYEERSSLYLPSSVVLEYQCASENADPTLESNLVEACDWGSVCVEDEDYNMGMPACARSIDASQSDKPYYNYGCSFIDFVRNPTGLEIDCRCRDVGDSQENTSPTTDRFADPNGGDRPGGAIVNCLSVAEQGRVVSPLPYGTGPSFHAWKLQNNSGEHWMGGAIDPEARVFYGVVRWTSPTHCRSSTVVSWELDSGNRAVISGIYPDPQLGPTEHGSGYLSPKPVGAACPTEEQPLTGVGSVRMGPDKHLYTLGGGTGEGPSRGREIVKTNLTTGERTLVWKSQDDSTGDISATYGQCLRESATPTTGLRESVAFAAQALAIDADGNFYLAFRGTEEGDGVASISADGKTCTILSRWGGQGSHMPLGQGEELQFPVYGMMVKEGKVYGVSNDDLYSFDIATGQRIKISYHQGTYGGMGYSNMFWDETRQVFWAVGTVAPYVGSIVDPVTGRRESIYGDSGYQEFGDEAILQSDYAKNFQIERSVDGTMLTNANSIGFGPVQLDPDDPNIVWGVLDGGALMKLELSTFNNYVHSF